MKLKSIKTKETMYLLYSYHRHHADRAFVLCHTGRKKKSWDINIDNIDKFTHTHTRGLLCECERIRVTIWSNVWHNYCCNAAHLRGSAYPAQCDDIMTPLGGNLQTSAADWWTEDRGIFSTLAILHQIIVSFDSFIFFWVFFLQNKYSKIIKYQNKRRLRVYYRTVAKTHEIILPNRASLNHIKPHYYCINVWLKCIIEILSSYAGPVY